MTHCTHRHNKPSLLATAVAFLVMVSFFAVAIACDSRPPNPTNPHAFGAVRDGTFTLPPGQKLFAVTTLDSGYRFITVDRLPSDTTPPQTYTVFGNDGAGELEVKIIIRESAISTAL